MNASGSKPTCGELDFNIIQNEEQMKMGVLYRQLFKSNKPDVMPRKEFTRKDVRVSQTAGDRTGGQKLHNQLPRSSGMKGQLQHSIGGEKYCQRQRLDSSHGQQSQTEEHSQQGQGRAHSQQGQGRAHSQQGQWSKHGQQGQGRAHNKQGQGRAHNQQGQGRAHNQQGQGREDCLGQDGHGGQQQLQARKKRQRKQKQHDMNLHQQGCTEQQEEHQRHKNHQRKVLQTDHFQQQQPCTHEQRAGGNKNVSPLSWAQLRPTSSVTDLKNPQMNTRAGSAGVSRQWIDIGTQRPITAVSNKNENSSNRQRISGENIREASDNKSSSRLHYVGERHSRSMIQNARSSPVMKSDFSSLVSAFDGMNINSLNVVFDDYNSDLNAEIGSSGYDIVTLNSPAGFRLLWAGCKANFGVLKGKVFFEVKLVEDLRSDCKHFSNEPHPNVVRIGWSEKNSSLDLGEEPLSFGYGSSGKFSTDHRYQNYSGHFGVADIIGALLDLDSRPATVSFMKNGKHLGIATPFFPDGQIIMYPHVFLKNYRILANFGQYQDWFSPPRGFQYIGRLRSTDVVGSYRPPDRKSQCEVIMIVGLPGAGKTTWATTQRKKHPEKRYNILGTDLLLERMKVTDMPSYRDRFDHLYPQAADCFQRLLKIASTKLRNYILDQTNVFDSARKKKMAAFSEFYKIAAVIQPSDHELVRRSRERTEKIGKNIPAGALREMKVNYSLPSSGTFDSIKFIELGEQETQTLVTRYNTSRQ